MNKDKLSGLSKREAISRLRKYGVNDLHLKQERSLAAKLFELVKEPMLLVLVLISGIYLLMGDFTEGAVLGASALFMVAITYYQNAKSERALAALRDLTSPRALVIRDGVEERIPAVELVPGDVIVLSEGDRVPADGIVLSSSHLNVDESMLTGESFPVRKDEFLEEPKNSKDAVLTQKVFMGTLVVGGRAHVKVRTTGVATEMGRIGGALAAPKEEVYLSREVRRIVAFFTWAGSCLCLFIALYYGLSRSDWAGGALVGLSTAMALLPEEFPVILTVFLAIGAWRLSKVRVLVRQPAAIERLGATTVLCVDKTGTLTENKMSLAAVSGAQKEQVIRCGLLASQAKPFDPMERAIESVAITGGDPRTGRVLVREYPLTKSLFATTFVWEKEGGEREAFMKGAPEVVLNFCSHLAKEEKDRIIASVHELAESGLRVLGVGRALSVNRLPDTQSEFSWEWVGLLGFEDPLRAEVPAAVGQCREAGIRVLMITGDYPETARRIAIKAGLHAQSTVLNGSEMESLDEDALRNKLREVSVCARMRPEHKLRIVNALKRDGHVVGMTGDGVNDAPSLKQADVGIAMGARGTDVAREAAAFVLTDDNFASITDGIRRGRAIFLNLKKSMSYVISIHVPLAGLALLPVLFGWPLLLMPIHIALLELIIDPSCSIMFEAQEPDAGVMQRPPRKLKSSLLQREDLVRCVGQGILVLGLVAAVYWHQLSDGQSDSRARALSFFLLGLCNISLIIADLTGGRPKEIFGLMTKKVNLALLTGVLGLLLLCVRQRTFASFLHLDLLGKFDLLALVAITFAFLIVVSGWNFLSGKR